MFCFFLGLPTCLIEDLNLQDNFISDKSIPFLFEILDPMTKIEATDLKTEML